jgi:regulator of protease activity HflC (stomatin/prohibitin superfamily)
MSVTILAVLFALMAFALIVGGRKAYKTSVARDRYDEDQAGPIAAMVIGGLLSLVTVGLLAYGSVTVVKANEVGVPVTLGKISESPIQSGPHFKAPWTDVEKLPTRPVTVEGQFTVRTSQAGKVTVNMATRWATDKPSASELYRQARTGDEDDISDKIVLKSLGQAVNQVYVSKTNVEASNERGVIAGEVNAALARLMKPYGITITDTNLRSAEPDEATQAAIATLAAEQQKTAVAAQAKITAENEAKTRLAIANGIKDAANATKNLSPEALASACLSANERAVNYAASKGVSVYVNLCGGTSSPNVIVNQK